jgi:hypothetical protein
MNNTMYHKEGIMIANKYMENVKPHISLGNCNSKQQWITIVHLLEWLKFEVPIVLSAEKDVEGQDLSFTTSENVKWHRHCRAVALSYKTNEIFIIWSNNGAPRYLSKLVKVYVHAKIYTWMFIVAFFLISKKWQQGNISLKHTVDYSISMLWNIIL